MASLRVWRDPTVPRRGPRRIVSRHLVVTNLDDQLIALKAEGIPVGPTQGTPGLVKVATVTDPEGNWVTFAEDLAGKN